MDGNGCVQGAGAVTFKGANCIYQQLNQVDSSTCPKKTDMYVDTTTQSFTLTQQLASVKQQSRQPDPLPKTNQKKKNNKKSNKPVYCMYFALVRSAEFSQRPATVTMVAYGIYGIRHSARPPPAAIANHSLATAQPNQHITTDIYPSVKQ